MKNVTSNFYGGKKFKLSFYMGTRQPPKHISVLPSLNKRTFTEISYNMTFTGRDTKLFEESSLRNKNRFSRSINCHYLLLKFEYF
jgi:hypothetical protein